jgi:hypothetical protein
MTVRILFIFFLSYAMVLFTQCRGRADVKDSELLTFRVDSQYFQQADGLRHYKEILNIKFSNDKVISYSDTIVNPGELKPVCLIDTMEGFMYFNEFSYRIHKMAVKDGSSVAQIEIPAMKALDHRWKNRAHFSIYKNYLFFSTPVDVLIMSKNLDFSATLSDESIKGMDRHHSEPKTYKVSYVVRNDSLEIKTSVIIDEENNRDSTYIHHIYLPKDPSLIDLSSYRIYGRDFSNIKLPNLSKPILE